MPHTPLSLITPHPDKPLLCLEVNPPRGADLSAVYARLDNALEGIDFLNVTDSALARMRLAALPCASLLKARYGIEPMVNVSCRDRNLIALQADLLAGWALGVRTVVALTGDAMSVGDTPEGKSVFEVNSVGLLNLVATLNGGKDLTGVELKGAPELFPGVVVNPNVRNASAEIRRLQKKRDAGARYALSQPVFDGDAAEEFLKEAQSLGMPIFLGLLPLKTAKSAAAMHKIPGLKFPEHLLAEIMAKGEGDLSNYFVDRCLAIAARCRPYVCGYHVVSGAYPTLALTLAGELARAKK